MTGATDTSERNSDADPFAVITDPVPDPPLDIVARALDVQPYDARALMTGDLPRLLTVTDDRNAARQLASDLANAGAPTVAVRAEPLLKQDTSQELANIQFDGGQLTGTTRGQPVAIDLDRIRLCIKMRAVTASTSTREVTEKKFSAARSLASGGLVNRKKVTSTVVAGQDLAESLVILIFVDDRIQPQFLLNGSTLNYGFLGDALSTSAITNFQTLCNKLQGACPEASWDDRLFRPGQSAPSGPTAGYFRQAGFQVVTARMIRILLVAN